jgi:hypothetical protein
MSAAFAFDLNLKKTMCVTTDMLVESFLGASGDEKVGEIQSKAVKKSTSMRVTTVRRRNLMGSMKR